MSETPSKVAEEVTASDDSSPVGWRKIETEYRRDAKRARALEDESMAAKYEMKTTPLKEKQAQLLDERQRLNEQLQAVKKQCDELEDQLNHIDLQYFEAREVVKKRRAFQDENAEIFFQNNKANALRSASLSGEVPEASEASETSEASEASHVDKLTAEAPNGVSNGVSNGVYNVGTPGSDDTAVDEPIRKVHRAIVPSSSPASSESSPLSQPPDDIADFTGAEIWDSDGQLVGPVKRLKLENRYVRNILQIPIQRRVKIRPGRKFTQETVDSIYEPSDNKGAKWLSCMIQATGEEQDTPCISCMNRAGTWAGCVIVGGSDFPRCANCEWNRQGCHGSSYHLDREQDPDMRPNLDSPVPHVADDSAQASREASSAGGFTPVNGAQMKPSIPTSAPPKRTSLPNKKGGRKSLPNTASSGKGKAEPVDDSVLGGDDEEGASEFDPGPDITKAGLHLRDNGVVFTEPEIMRGVPLERISPDHPYWDPTWSEVEGILQAKLNDWQGKLDTCLAQNRNRFLAGRQVNRGKTIMAFLQNADFHPYQLLGKDFISKNLVTYDTIFRLAQVIEELPRLHVDVKPVEWVRERMHELYTEQGTNFSLSKTVHELYHDPKLRALRTRAGFGNIGRPSGVKKGMTSKSGQIRPKDRNDTPTPRKRRRPSSAASTRSNKSAKHETRQQVNETPASPRGVKKQRVHTGRLPTPDGEHTQQSNTVSPTTSAKPNANDEFYHSGYTSTDSYSGDKVTAVDWRIIQVRTKLHTTNKQHTQFWHWVGDKHNPHFEHQVLRTVRPVTTWGVYTEPHDFHLRLAELEKVEYSTEDGCDKIIVYTTNKHRGKVIVQFKRHNTVTRWMYFLKHKASKQVVLEQVPR